MFEMPPSRVRHMHKGLQGIGVLSLSVVMCVLLLGNIGSRRGHLAHPGARLLQGNHALVEFSQRPVSPGLFTAPIEPLMHQALLTPKYVYHFSLSKASLGGQRTSLPSLRMQVHDEQTETRAAAQLKTRPYLSEQVVTFPLLI